MTPRQIIQEISERRYLQSSFAEHYLQTNDLRDGRESAESTLSKQESESNKEIKVSKLQYLVPNIERSATVNNNNSRNMYSSRRHSFDVSCYGSALLRKNTHDDSQPTNYCYKERSRPPTQPQVSFNTLYTTFKNINEKNRRLKAQRSVHESTVLPRMRKENGVVGRSEELCLENGWIVGGETASMSDIRGRPKQIHAKTTGDDGNRETGQGLKNLGRKRLQEARGIEKSAFRLEQERKNQCGVVQDSNNDKRLLLHIYIPTADMSG